MPNWCNNRVTVSGDNLKDMQRVRKIFESDEIFGQIVPSPDWSTIPLAEDDLESLGRKRGELGELPEYEEIKNPKGDVIHRGYKFASTDCQDDRWYNWQLSNWGTKWDICKDHIEWGQDDEDYMVLHFDTAWSPPEEICHALREKFPDLGIEWFYDEPGMQVAGYL